MDRLRQLYALMEDDIGRMLVRYSERIAGHDEVRLDAPSRTAAFLRGGAVLWRAHAEPLGRLNPAFHAFRWWWFGRPAPTTRVARRDAIAVDGQRFAIPELTTEQVPVRNDEEVLLLCNVAARLAGAEGVVRVDDAHGALYVALFDTPGLATASLFPPMEVAEAPSEAPRHYSIPAPVIVGTTGIRTPTFVVRSPPPSPNAPATEPRRDVLAPLAQAAYGAASAALRDAFSEVMLVVLVDVLQTETRAFVQLVALAPGPDIVSLDVGLDLARAAERMIEADSAAGNGRWSKLVVRMRRTATGATVEVDVKT